MPFSLIEGIRQQVGTFGSSKTGFGFNQARPCLIMAVKLNPRAQFITLHSYRKHASNPLKAAFVFPDNRDSTYSVKRDSLDKTYPMKSPDYKDKTLWEFLLKS